MKFMKLGSKPDTFKTDGNNVWFVPSDLAADVIINVGDSKFYLHKFPLLSKSGRLQKLVGSADEEIDIHEIPGGSSAFEICAKFCYGMTVTLNAHNVVSVYCAADYLEMHETVDKGNLVYKLSVFMNSSIFRSWKDSIIVLQTTRYMSSSSSEAPKLVNLCINSIASKASVDVSKVDWSYTYNRGKLPEEIEPVVSELNNGIRSRMVPKDWWVEDLAELEMGLYKQVLVSIKSKGLVGNEVIGEALKAFALRRLPGFKRSIVHSGDVSKARSVVDIIARLLPLEKGCVSCDFLLKLLKMAVLVDSGETVRRELVKRISQQLEEATVQDLLIRVNKGDGEPERLMYDVDIVREIVKEFVDQDQISEFGDEDREIQETGRTGGGILSEASKLMVAKLVDGYLTEISKDPNLPLGMFVDLAEMVSGFPRPSHDGLYRAIDMYLKAHLAITKSERKRICRLMDCKKLSVDACAHAVQNERLPMRVVVQVLFFEQARAATSSGSSTPDLPKSIKALNVSNGKPATGPEDEWDGVATVEELKALKEELAALRMQNPGPKSTVSDKASVPRVKGLLSTKKIFSKIWSSKGGTRENSGSDSSESLGSAHPDEGKSTPSRKGRYSVS
ncbi:putative BTB/POZ domain, NPH3 domain, NPH3/RPT2-like family protein [Helianthus annuus]|uniref:BTB/POZ domain-containing protein NPY2 n=1 Tax=Helianthus annuus TaxID=4232 RepID=A0A251V739_HELAN|nr:BTB/POZ domain-containing protein NPY2 [Helianthus annuus]XP_022028025.1 BTB/POZ domain-containing protein NPY2 [Helianthus annuus]XP_022028027.1 BTB/POZ domain-containing protein NPY2 [Helianthus annuus]XP_035843411.1 BTB/POZ domain-containing protein NPY2 [Helianthus annuus]XP_035843412.1 BTB/POZ domain-containing protein NPY2 [Helianthus annuus]XP_035843413.1 BTB/POZ domain-containing protein NPY2 [Helianthus annuus]KAF5814137.1 putative BTB/POZ domain-containing protein NPY2 [Helianthu